MTAPAHDGLIAGRYQLVAPIGSGGSAAVYRGLDIMRDLEVAVKQLTPAPAADAGLQAGAIERILCEARAASRIHHPGVAEVYDVVSGEDSSYIVMQLINGRPLAELIAEQGPLPPHRVAGIGRQKLVNAPELILTERAGLGPGRGSGRLRPAEAGSPRPDSPRPGPCRPDSPGLPPAHGRYG